MAIDRSKLKAFLQELSGLEDDEKAAKTNELKASDPTLYAQFKALTKGARKAEDARVALTENPDIVAAIDAAAQSPRVQHLAATLGQVGGENRNSIIAGVAASSPALAEALRRAMFSFEDLQYGEARGLQSLIARIDKKTLRFALRGASEDTLERLYGQMSKRAAEQLREDIEYMGRIPKRDVLKAQNEIELVARKMMKAGELVIIKPGDEETWVR